HAGLLIFFVAALIFRRRMRSRIPISLVYFLAVANEIVDMFTPGHTAPSWQSAVDILNTVFWPTLLYLLARRRGTIDDPHRAAIDSLTESVGAADIATTRTDWQTSRPKGPHDR